MDYYSGTKGNVLILRYIIYMTPGWLLLFSSSVEEIFSFFSLSTGSKHNHRAEITASWIIMVIVIFSGVDNLEAEYYGTEYKSDFKGMAESIDSMDLPSDTMIIRQPGRGYIDVYLDRMGSENRAEFGSWSSQIPSSALSHIEDNQPEYIIYALGHDPGYFRNLDFIEQLENGNYSIIEHRTNFFKGELYVFQR